LRRSSRTRSGSQSAVANNRCIPSGVASPACSASCQPFLRPTLPTSPRRYASTRRRGSARTNRPAIRACTASSPAAHARTSSISAAASLASGTVPCPPWRSALPAPPGRRAGGNPTSSQMGRVGDWCGPVGHGPFPVPARQTVRAVLPHTAYRRFSPAVFGLAAPVPEGSGRNDGSIEADQAHPVGRQEQLFEAPSPGSSPVALLGQPDREPLEGVVPDLAKDAGGVAVAEVSRPAAQEQVEVPDDVLDRHPEPPPAGDLPDPVAGSLDGLACGPASEEGQVCRFRGPPAH